MLTQRVIAFPGWTIHYGTAKIQAKSTRTSPCVRAGVLCQHNCRWGVEGVGLGKPTLGRMFVGSNKRHFPHPAVSLGR